MPGRLVLLCGRSFSGKSTVARALGAGLPGVVVSLDEINTERGLDGGQGIPIEEWGRTNVIARERVTDELSRDNTVIVDDTGSPRFLRDGWRELSAGQGAQLVLVFIDAATETLVQRQAANRTSGARHNVVDAVMSEHLDSFESPTDNEDPLRFTTESLSTAGVVEAVKDRFSRADRPAADRSTTDR